VHAIWILRFRSRSASRPPKVILSDPLRNEAAYIHPPEEPRHSENRGFHQTIVVVIGLHVPPDASKPPTDCQSQDTNWTECNTAISAGQETVQKHGCRKGPFVAWYSPAKPRRQVKGSSIRCLQSGSAHPVSGRSAHTRERSELLNRHPNGSACR
jgi:hypothetical protein